MRKSVIAVVILALIVACDAGPATPLNDSLGSTVSAVESTVPIETTTAASETLPTEGTDPKATEDSPRDPSYEVFLAAVAEAVVDTRFANVPFDEPEITVATGLALCEAIAAGEDPDDIIVEFLADLTDGPPTDADNDQLVLTGALIGAAESALCPDDL